MTALPMPDRDELDDVYDPNTGRFDPIALHLAMVKRQLNRARLVEATGLKTSTVRKVCRGEHVVMDTVGRVVKALSAVTPAALR